jgi:hypothetical protein
LILTQRCVSVVTERRPSTPSAEGDDAAMLVERHVDDTS